VILTGRVDLTDKTLILQRATETAPAITLNYGNFLASLINFLIIAVVLFLVIRQINRLAKADKEESERK
jgi:large conductance mechanosensitive channel